MVFLESPKQCYFTFEIAKKWWNCSWDDMNIVKKRKPQKRNWISVDSNKNNATRTNHIKAKIDYTQQNSICRLCGERDEIVKHIIRKCSKLTQNEYKNRHDWVGKAIHGKLCKKLKFDHADKWYIHKPESVLENEMYKILWDFETQTNLSILVRRPDLLLINKEKELVN